MSDAQIPKGIESDPDAHPTDEEFWKNAKVVWPSRKAVVTMRLDSDLLQWFRRQRGYQTRINAILRSYMNAHESGPRR
ncbi:MAG: BrnA antitoxin family protein [Terriglobia bacterium]